MAKQASALSRLQIASPCPASWDAMQGDERSRFCHDCKLQVYNISAMSKNEAEALILQKEGRLCFRIYRRQDGTIITQNCPRALRWLRNKLRFAVYVFAGLLSWFLSYCKGEAQELRLTPPKHEEFFDPRGTLTIGSSGGYVGLPPKILSSLEEKLPRISPFVDNGCEVLLGNPPQLVLAIKRHLKQKTINNYGIDNLQPTDASERISLYYDSFQQVPMTDQFEPDLSGNNVQLPRTVNGDRGSCTEDTTDIFVLLQKKRHRK